MARYSAWIDGKICGPFSPEQIAKHPQIGPDTRVIREGLTKREDWRQARDVPELMALYARHVPPPLPASSPAIRSREGSQAPAARPVPPPLPPASPSSHLPRSQAPVTRYWIRADGQKLGPFTREEIQQSPVVNEDTLVLPEGIEGSEDWVKLRQVPELMALCAGQPDRPYYRCASCEREFADRGMWERHRLGCRGFSWERTYSEALRALIVGGLSVSRPFVVASILVAGGLLAWRLIAGPTPKTSSYPQADASSHKKALVIVISTKPILRSITVGKHSDLESALTAKYIVSVTPKVGGGVVYVWRYNEAPQKTWFQVERSHGSVFDVFMQIGMGSQQARYRVDLSNGATERVFDQVSGAFGY